MSHLWGERCSLSIQIVSNWLNSIVRREYPGRDRDLDCDSVAQEVLIATHGKVSPPQVLDRPLVYLLVALRRKANGILRRRSRGFSFPLDEDWDAGIRQGSAPKTSYHSTATTQPEQAAMVVDLLSAIREALGETSELVIRLMIQDLTFSEIGMRLNLSERTVRRKRDQVREWYRRQLQERNCE